MRVGYVFVALVIAGCAADRRRPALEEVPIGTTPHEASGDVTSAPMPTAPAATTSGPTVSVAERAKALMTRGDTKGARALIEPRVADKSATPEEVTLLRGMCKAAHDARCLAKLK